MKHLRSITWELSPETMLGLLLVAAVVSKGSEAFARYLVGHAMKEKSS